MATKTTSDTQRDTSAELDGVEVVMAFLDALQRMDVDAAAELLTDDAVWINVGLPAVEGKAAIVAALSRMGKLRGAGFTVEMHNIVADGDVVLTERTDGLWAGPVGGEFWVCGTFELRDGEIAVWRDRFDHVAAVRGVLVGTTRRLLELARGR